MSEALKAAFDKVVGAWGNTPEDQKAAVPAEVAAALNELVAVVASEAQAA